MSPTFADLSQEWLRVYSAPRHSAEWHEKSTYYLHSCILPKFGPLSVDDVKQQEVARMVNAIAEAGLRVKANHVLVTTRGVFAWGITTGRIGCPNPARDIKRQKVGKGERVLSRQELAAVWHASAGLGEWGIICRLLILTGCRCTEVGSLVWAEVNREARQLELPKERVKNRRAHIVPLSDLALAQLPKARPGYPNLFGRSIGRPPEHLGLLLRQGYSAALVRGFGRGKPMRLVLGIVLAIVANAIALSAWPTVASAQKRVALVIGNSAYQHTSRLVNPINDATDMSAALKSVGFVVIDGFDLSKATLELKIRAFEEALQGAAVGLFFYAGHGMQAGGRNYLVPIDARIARQSDIEVELVRLDLVLEAMRREDRTNILFLDAFRDLPLLRTMTRNRTAAANDRVSDLQPGFSPMEAGGALIGFSGQPGRTAMDGGGRNSAYTAALVKEITTSNDDLNTILARVGDQVKEETGGRQVPSQQAPMTTPRFYFKARPSPDATEAERELARKKAEDRQFGGPPPRRRVVGGEVAPERKAEEERARQEAEARRMADAATAERKAAEERALREAEAKRLADANAAEKRTAEEAAKKDAEAEARAKAEAERMARAREATLKWTEEASRQKTEPARRRDRTSSMAEGEAPARRNAAEERVKQCLASGGCTPIKVFFGSDRKRADQPLRIDFGVDRDSALHLGQANVTVPRGVKRKLGWFEQAFLGTPAAGDPARHFTIPPNGITIYASEKDFLAAVAAYMKEAGNFKDHAFIFVHGANTTFEFALYRTAQIAFDLGVDGQPFGTPFLFSWPSQGSVEGYAYDLDSVRFAVDHLAAFIKTVIEKTATKHVHLIAHSMGNWPTLVALEKVAASTNRRAKLGQVVLAAPDVDAEEFTRMVAKVLPAAQGLTLYASSSDAAMIASRKLRKDTYRAGDVPPPPGGPVVLKGIDTIDVSLVGTDVFTLAHSEYAERRELLNDIALLFREGVRPPSKRTPILRTERIGGQQYWRFPPN